MKAKNSKKIYLVIWLFFFGGFGWLIFSGLSEEKIYFLNISEALNLELTKRDHARLFGSVAADNLVRDPQSLGVFFNLEDKLDPSKFLRVEYRGAVPDTFRPGVEVIAEGRFNKQSGVFLASILITKCPSKYQKERVEASIKKG